MISVKENGVERRTLNGAVAMEDFVNLVCLVERTSRMDGTLAIDIKMKNVYWGKAWNGSVVLSKSFLAVKSLTEAIVTRCEDRFSTFGFPTS